MSDAPEAARMEVERVRAPRSRRTLITAVAVAAVITVGALAVYGALNRARTADHGRVLIAVWGLNAERASQVSGRMSAELEALGFAVFEAEPLAAERSEQDVRQMMQRRAEIATIRTWVVLRVEPQPRPTEDRASRAEAGGAYAAARLTTLVHDGHRLSRDRPMILGQDGVDDTRAWDLLAARIALIRRAFVARATLDTIGGALDEMPPDDLSIRDRRLAATYRGITDLEQVLEVPACESLEQEREALRCGTSRCAEEFAVGALDDGSSLVWVSTRTRVLGIERAQAVRTEERIERRPPNPAGGMPQVLVYARHLGGYPVLDSRGRAMLFVRERELRLSDDGAPDVQSELWWMNLDAPHQRRLLFSRSGRNSILSPSLTHDDQVVFITDDGTAVVRTLQGRSVGSIPRANAFRLAPEPPLRMALLEGSEAGEQSLVLYDRNLARRATALRFPRPENPRGPTRQELVGYWGERVYLLNQTDGATELRWPIDGQSAGTLVLEGRVRRARVLAERLVGETESGQSRVVVAIDATDGSLTPLTPDGLLVRYPRVSPNGRHWVAERVDYIRGHGASTRVCSLTLGDSP